VQSGAGKLSCNKTALLLLLLLQWKTNRTNFHCDTTAAVLALRVGDDAVDDEGLAGVMEY